MITEANTMIIGPDVGRIHAEAEGIGDGGLEKSIKVHAGAEDRRTVKLR